MSEVTNQKGDAVNEGGKEELFPERGLGEDWKAPSLLLLVLCCCLTAAPCWINSSPVLLIAFAFPLPSVCVRLLSHVSDLTDLIFYFNKGKTG